MSMIALRSREYWGVGTKDGGRGLSFGMFSSGSPVMFRTIRNRSGRFVTTGRTFCETGLYFFFVIVKTGGIESDVKISEGEMEEESCIIEAFKADKNVAYCSLAVKYKFAMIEERVGEFKEVKELILGMFTVYSIVIRIRKVK